MKYSVPSHPLFILRGFHGTLMILPKQYSILGNCDKQALRQRYRKRLYALKLDTYKYKEKLLQAMTWVKILTVHNISMNVRNGNRVCMISFGQNGAYFLISLYFHHFSWDFLESYLVRDSDTFADKCASHFKVASYTFS